MWRTVRKTLGTLFLVSALVIAAIPVDNLRASETGERVMGSGVSVVPDVAIPQVRDSDKVYTTEDTLLSFVYIPSNRNDPNSSYRAVIVGYEKDTALEGNKLKIPDTVEAYRQYTANQGQAGGYAAVGRNGNFLFYRQRTTTQLNAPPAEGYGVEPNYYELVREELQEDGSRIYTVTMETGDFQVCYLSTKANWIEYDSNATNSNSRLYYDNRDDTGNSFSATGYEDNKDYFKKVGGNQTYARIANVTVNYISDQYWDGSKWQSVTSANPTKGVFAEAGNIVELTVGDNFNGVGAYAFYGCTSLESIKFNNGLSAIGEGAFSNCSNLKGIELPLSCNLTAIGVKAFEACTQLTSFTLPVNVTQIGDYAFDGCERLKTVDLCSEGATAAGETSNRLRQVGAFAFRNCKALESLTFSDSCPAQIDLSCFDGCTSLKSICARNPQMNFMGDYTGFKTMLGGDSTDFYFEGIAGSALHKMCREQQFAFSYIYDSTGGFGQQNRYELTLGDGGQGTDTFVVNRDGELLSYSYTGEEKNLTIPSKIGPYNIVSVSNGVFQDHCNLEQVTIPATVTSIKSGAFKGCHNLEWVTFASENVAIEGDAFATQSVGTHQTASHNGPYVCGGSVESDSEGFPKAKLHFVGSISPTSGAFNHAMSGNGKYSNTLQHDSYIIYCSGLPQNLEVEYNPDTHMSELVRFPSLKELSTSHYNSLEYAYLGDDYAKTAEEAVNAYLGGGSSLVGEQQRIIDSALKIEVPNGIQSIKPGLFKEKDKANSEYLTEQGSNTLLEMSATVYSLAAIESGEEAEDETTYGGIKDGTGTFAGCIHLVGVDLVETDTATVIEDHAFQNCKMLTDVAISPKVSEIGICPFYNCSKLSTINFKNSPYYACDNSIIYALGNAEGEGEKPRIAIVECLTRDDTAIDVPESEFESELMNISEIRPEAFRGSNVRTVNLRSTAIQTIPTGTFADTENLQSVYFPSTLRNIENYAVVGSNIDSFYVYGTDVRASMYTFAGLKKDPSKVSWFCLQDEDTRTYETGFDAGFLMKDLPVPTEYTVNFEYYNTDGKLVYENGAQTVIEGEEHKIVYPDVAQQIITEEGLPQAFTGWERRVNEERKEWTYVAKYRTITWTVTAMDSPERGSAILGTVSVVQGFDASKQLEDLLKENVPEDVYGSFNGWSCAGDYTSVNEDLTVVATYVPEGMYIVRYYAMVGSYNNYELYTRQTVREGEGAPNIAPPGEGFEVPGYSFVEWQDLPTRVDKNWDVYGRYKPSSGNGDDSNGGNTGSGNGTNNPNGTGSGNGTNNPNNPNGGNTGSSNDVARHTLQVRGGSGSGLYAAGEQIIITADEPARGQQFSSWTVSPASTVVTDKTLSSFILTMPDNDVAVIANYKARSGSSSTTGSGNSSNTNSNRPNGSTGTVGGTSVVIDKNGLSNTGVVSATVNGSSDNFTIKITDDTSATEAVLRALQAEYGSLDNIKYFPMDISLYDSTGTTKITDTTGLSVDITLPLPDSLITYAGNNKVAGVVNDRLDKLTPRFTTINGVACMTFRAEHFSPYVIYVDIANLSDGTISDNTPTTGDGIHPKWFLSIGLACLSFVMFMIKDNKSGVRRKQKVAVRARH